MHCLFKKKEKVEIFDTLKEEDEGNKEDGEGEGEKKEKLDKREDNKDIKQVVEENPNSKEEKKENIAGDEEDKKEKKEEQEENKEISSKTVEMVVDPPDKTNDKNEIKEVYSEEDISKLSDKLAFHATTENVYQDILELEKAMEESGHKNITNDPEHSLEAAKSLLSTKFDGTLTIVVHKATDLSNDSGKNKKREPYIKLHLKDNKESKLLKVKTKVCKSTNPVWDEFFETQVSFDGPLKLKLSVYDGWDFLGKATHVFDTSHNFGEPVDISLQPKKKNQVVTGTVTFSIRYDGVVPIVIPSSDKPDKKPDRSSKKIIFGRALKAAKKKIKKKSSRHWNGYFFNPLRRCCTNRYPKF